MDLCTLKEGWSEVGGVMGVGTLKEVVEDVSK